MERRERLGQSGSVVWITASNPGPALEVAYSLERRLFDLGHVAMVLNALDFSVQTSSFEIARRAAAAGLVTLVVAPPLSPAERDTLTKEGALVEVRVTSPLDGAHESEGPSVPFYMSVAEGDVEKAAEQIASALRLRRIFV
jgi:hypothetical protein